MAKKSMIEREKKRMRLNQKYALKRATLLNKYRTEENFNMKLEIHSQLQKLPRNRCLHPFLDSGDRAVGHDTFLGILAFL